MKSLMKWKKHLALLLAIVLFTGSFAGYTAGIPVVMAEESITETEKEPVVETESAAEETTELTEITEELKETTEAALDMTEEEKNTEDTVELSESLEPVLYGTRSFAMRSSAALMTASASDEPVYDASSHDLKYSAETHTMSAWAWVKYQDNLSIAADETYWQSFTWDGVSTDVRIRGEGKDSSCYLKLRTNSLYVTENETHTWSKTSGLTMGSGAVITIESTATTVSVWVNHEKIIDNWTLIEANKNKPVEPAVRCSSGSLTYVQIWKEKSGETVTSDEPMYDKIKHESLYTAEAHAMSAWAWAKYQDNLSIAADETYWQSFTWDGNATDVRIRGIESEITCYLKLRNNSLYVTEGNDSTHTWSKTTGLTMGNGAVITIESTATTVSVWVNHEKIIDNWTLIEANKNKPVEPAVRCSSGSLTSVQIWKVKNEPVYDGNIDVLFPVTGVSNNAATYVNNTVTIPANNNCLFQSALPEDSDYYVSMNVKTNNYVNICWRGTGDDDVLLNLQPSGYQFTAGANKEWKTKSFSLAEGVKVTIATVGGTTTIWADGECIYSEQDPSTGKSIPGIGWSFNDEVTVSNIQIWKREAPVTINFKGGSLRKDSADFTKTSLRFGYDFKLADGLELVSWSWNVGKAENALTIPAQGVNKIDNADGSYTSNVVVIDIPKANFNTTLYTQLTVVYKVSGQEETHSFTEATVQKKNVQNVIDAILTDTNAKENDKTYANALKDLSTTTAE